MNVRKRKQAERKYREEHKEEIERAEKDRQTELQEIYDAIKNPEKRYWKERFNNTLKLTPHIGWGATIWNAIRDLKKVYVEKGWMNESGEWIQ
jgi:hypothetical protein